MVGFKQRLAPRNAAEVEDLRTLGQGTAGLSCCWVECHGTYRPLITVRAAGHVVGHGHTQPAPADGHDVPSSPPLRLRLGRGPRRPGCRPRELTGFTLDHQYSLSSLPSIARTWSREQLSQ